MNDCNDIIIAVVVINILFHLIGLTALISLYSKSIQKPQRLILISLSIGEVLQNITLFFFIDLFVFNFEDRHIIRVVVLALNKLLYVNLFFIAIERLAKFILNTKYSNYWNEQHTKYLLFVSWIFIFLISVIIFVCANEKEKVLLNMQAIFDLSFILIMSFVFLMIICRYNRITESMKQKLQRTVFIVPFLLVSSFIIFYILPNIINVYYRKKGLKITFGIAFPSLMSKVILFMIHAAVHSILLKDISKYILMKINILLKKLKGSYCRTKDEMDDIYHLELITADPIKIQCHKRLSSIA